MNLIKIKSVRDLGIQFKDNPNMMIGQDGAYSIPLENKILWYFGDTLIGKRRKGESIWYPNGKAVGPKDMSGRGTIRQMLNNTGLLLYNRNCKDGFRDFKYITDDSGNIKTLIPLLRNEHNDEIRVWCLHGVYLNENVYLFFIKVRMIEEGIFPVNFDVIGSGIAVGSKKDWGFNRLTLNNSDVIWNKDKPKFASAVLKDEQNNLLYLYGVVQDKVGVQQCYLAKVIANKIENFEQYEYLSSNSPEWNKDIRKAIPVFSGMPNELSVSYNSYLNKYLAVHSLDLTGKIVGRTSRTPWGPWSEPTTLYEVKVERELELPYPILIYAGKEHPSLSVNNGKIIYITYVEFEEYYPHLIEFEFE